MGTNISHLFEPKIFRFLTSYLGSPSSICQILFLNHQFCKQGGYHDPEEGKSSETQWKKLIAKLFEVRQLKVRSEQLSSLVSGLKNVEVSYGAPVGGVFFCLGKIPGRDLGFGTPASSLKNVHELIVIREQD